jgi:hypothetical protein
MKKIKIGNWYWVVDFEFGYRPVKVEKQDLCTGEWTCRYTDGYASPFDESELFNDDERRTAWERERR